MNDIAVTPTPEVVRLRRELAEARDTRVESELLAEVDRLNAQLTAALDALREVKAWWDEMYPTGGWAPPGGQTVGRVMVIREMVNRALAAAPRPGDQEKT